jgi:DNA-binding beta-propeller fold protein YncE
MPEPIHAPELTGAVDWLNVSRPLTLKSDLKGKIVLLDFWTYGCINCLHILPDLQRLEEKYRDELVVIGIHSAKFTNERVSDNIRRIVVRYGIEHPVANDAEFRIWRAYGVRAWPTLVLIDPAGYVVATASGEGKTEAFDEAIAAVQIMFDERGELNRAQIPLKLEGVGDADRELRFPGKIVAHAASERLFIADSNHHRVVVTSMDGGILDVAGSGMPGSRDGRFDEAGFSRPQGLALDGTATTLFVADTGNHLVRAVDLKTRVVETVAGTGKQAAWSGTGGAAASTSLNSPWDLVWCVRPAGALLFVAMAGSHQIWLIDLQRRLAFPYAGSGREARADGGAEDSAFAQPSGLALSADRLYVADAESNIIRSVSLPPANQVATLAGGDLFDFGDQDGRGDTVRLQHPLGIAWHDERLFIADTYNHKIKVLDPASGAVTTFAGDGHAGHVDGTVTRARFHEPGGLSAASGRLYVADTNNHAVRVIDVSGGTVSTLPVRPRA